MGIKEVYNRIQQKRNTNQFIFKNWYPKSSYWKGSVQELENVLAIIEEECPEVKEKEE